MSAPDRSRDGFTIAEILVAIVIGGLLIVAVAHLTDTTSRVGEASRSGADARALEWTTERVLRRALEEAGGGMASSPNVGGVGVRIASGPDGAAVDTLVVLRSEGAGFPVAARGCRIEGAGCIALVGDRRAGLRRGDLLVVGTRSTGFAAYQLTGDPASFVAPCGADCAERLHCPVTPGPALSFRRIAGSVRQPDGILSAEPCPHAYFPDGSRCVEIEDTVVAGTRLEPSCRMVGATSTFTELPVVDRTVMLGFPAPPAPLTRSGAAGIPRVRAIRVRASRFWVRGAGDSVLVRQNGLAASGEWRPPVAVAGPIRVFQVETLHPDGTWRRGTGVAPSDLEPARSNPNYLWRTVPAAHGRDPGSTFLRGHHTISAVRIHVGYLTRSAANGEPRSESAWLVVATPALLEGGTGDAP